MRYLPPRPRGDVQTDASTHPDTVQAGPGRRHRLSAALEPRTTHHRSTPRGTSDHV
jgi:hypothetical protein